MQAEREGSLAQAQQAVEELRRERQQLVETLDRKNQQIDQLTEERNQAEERYTQLNRVRLELANELTTAKTTDISAKVSE